MKRAFYPFYDGLGYVVRMNNNSGLQKDKMMPEK
jgi:hypothetical protein